MTAKTLLNWGGKRDPEGGRSPSPRLCSLSFHDEAEPPVEQLSGRSLAILSKLLK